MKLDFNFLSNTTRVAMTDSKTATEGASTSEEPCCAEVVRCFCGCLLARQVPGGIELKCKRCKRTLVIPLSLPEEA